VRITVSCSPILVRRAASVAFHHAHHVLDGVVDPAGTILITDRAWTDNWSFVIANSGGADTHGFIRTDAGGVRHLEGANYLFVDGHVKWLKPTSIKCEISPDKCMWSIEDPG